MAIDLESLKKERDLLKESLRELENDQRRLDTEQKQLRQKEIRTKRMIEALDTLIDVREDQPDASNNSEATTSASSQ